MKDEWGRPISTLSIYLSNQFHIQAVKKFNNLTLYIFLTTDVLTSIYFQVTAHEIAIIDLHNFAVQSPTRFGYP
jgi:hypothetical protein